MESVHNQKNNSVPVSLDYDLISLSNTLLHSFEDGLHLAAAMLNAPFFIVNLYDYVIIRSDISKIDDPIWRSIGETRFCNSEVIAENKNIYSSIVPRIGKIVFYSTSEPSFRQRQLAPYIAWIISSFSQDKFYISDSISSSQSAFLFYLVNNRLDLANHQFYDFLLDKLPQQMQILVCFSKNLTEDCAAKISEMCNRTKYITIYRQKYKTFLISCLHSEQAEALSKLLAQNHIYAGLSFPFNDFNMCRIHALQAVAALNEASKQRLEGYLAYYEDLFALDVFYNYFSDKPLSTFRHPVFLSLEEYDKSNNSIFYKTQIAYIESSGSTEKTAKRLCMHRNTVLYQLKKIIEITGYNIQDSSLRASLLYAMTIEQTLKKLK